MLIYWVLLSLLSTYADRQFFSHGPRWLLPNATICSVISAFKGPLKIANAGVQHVARVLVPMMSNLSIYDEDVQAVCARDGNPKALR